MVQRSSQQIKVDLPVGILGGGQLARMLAMAAQQMGLVVHVLSEQWNDPAAQVVRHWHKGNPKKESSLKRFFDYVELATFESEFLDGVVLSRAARLRDCQIFPDPLLMERIQDRLEQKQLLLRQEVPTSPFLVIHDLEDAKAAIDQLGLPVVFKKRRFGYDGYGTFVVRKSADLRLVARELRSSDIGMIAEKYVAFERELAVIAARSANGDTVFLPLVETRQKDSRCLWVRGPVESPFYADLQKRLRGFLDDTGYIGVMGIEMFETKRGLMVNELAPRVHNSGHYSMDALNESQFALHWKCLLGMPLSTPTLKAPAFAMFNLLGDARTHRQVLLSAPTNVHVHWYGKSEARPGRKLGHLNALGEDSGELLKRLQSARKNFYL